MRLLLVRHGQSEWNATRRLQGQADISLTAKGHDQAASLAPVIASLAPDRAITSDLLRARATADRLGHPAARPEPGLREIGVGVWEGRPIDDLMAEDPSAYSGWRAGRHTPPGGESWEDFTRRTVTVVEKELAAGSRILLAVCHGGVIRALLSHYAGLAPAHIIPVGPASLTVLQISPGRPARLELFNMRAGMPEFGAPD